MSEHPAATAPAVARGNESLSGPVSRLTVGSFGRRHQPPPGTRARCLAAPGLAPSRIRRWCACRVPSRCPRPGPGCDIWPGTRRLPGSSLPGHRDVGMIPAQPSPAPSPPWPGSDGAAPGIPGAAGIAWRDWRWRAASASCGQPLVPTGPQSPARIFSNHTVPAGAPLRNRTVDLLLTMHAGFVCCRRAGSDYRRSGTILMSERVALRPALPGVVVTWFVTGQRVLDACGSAAIHPRTRLPDRDTDSLLARRCRRWDVPSNTHILRAWRNIFGANNLSTARPPNVRYADK